MRAVAYEMFKTLNSLNPNFKKEAFYHSLNTISKQCSFPKYSKFGNRRFKLIWKGFCPEKTLDFVNSQVIYHF